MNPTDILLSIAIVGIYTLIYVYLRHNYKSYKKIFKLFSEGFVYATVITAIPLLFLLIAVYSISNLALRENMDEFYKSLSNIKNIDTIK